MIPQSQPTRRTETAAVVFQRIIKGIHRVLPRFLKWIPVTWIGFALIGGTCFGLDIIVLTALHGGVDMSYPLAVTLGYIAASIANFILNRWLNFQAHGDITKQSGKQLVVIVSNFVIWILGFSTLLEVLNVQYQVARVTAALIEGLYMYLLMRIWVFPREKKKAEAAVTESAPADPGDPAATANPTVEPAAGH